MSSIASVSHGELASIKPVPLIGDHAARGALWTIFFSVLNKLGTVGSQVALAWFLFPADFGLVALALSVTSFAAMVCGANLRSILIQRPKYQPKL
jgi:O-antigen/teichoic acid export membrane protein